MTPSLRTLRTLGTITIGALAAVALTTPRDADAKFIFQHNQPDLDWYQIETEHFFIHYPKSHDLEHSKHPTDATFMAQRTAKVAEEMWEPMCAQFDYYLTEKVHIVLLDQSDDLEGFTIPAWNWIEVSGDPGGYFYRMRGRMEWFSDVLVHEFAHVVSLKRASAFGEGSQAISVGGLWRDGVYDTEDGIDVTLQGDTTPFWWVEGGAEYWSDTADYNWWTAARDANLRTTVLDDRLLTYDEWVQVQDKRDWGDGERGYQGGYSFGLYLRERFGKQVYAEFAKTSAKKWRANWETIVEDVTGVPLHQLYDDWKAFLTDKYTKQRDAIVAEGLAVGDELETSTGDWEAHDPDARDEFYWQGRKSERRARMDRERKRHSTGTWEFYPRMSPDGKWIADAGSYGVSVTQLPEDVLPSIAGYDPGYTDQDLLRKAGDSTAMLPNDGAAFGHGFDFVPGQDKVVITATEDTWGINKAKLPWLRVEADGYDRNQLVIADLTPREDKRKHHDGKETYTTNTPKTWLSVPMDQDRFTVIPNTLRGMDPAVSPDGKQVAYLEYGDGTTNLVVIGLDGTGKRALTNFDDGSWLQGPDWSPDGKRIVFSMVRNFRQDLWVADVATGELTALNRDSSEEQDPFWAPDGSIWFSSEPTGVFNIFRFDPATSKVTQITNVIGGAECPWVTPQGNLLYTGFTAFGWKSYALAGDEFFDKDVTAKFKFNPDPVEYKADLAYKEDIAALFETKKEATDGLNPITNVKKNPVLGSWMPPTAVPIFRVENDSRDSFGVSGGAQIYAQDFVENQTVFGFFLLGEDPLVAGGYTWQGWYPNISITAMHYEAKFDYAFLIDGDNDQATTNDQKIFEGKQNQFVNRGGIDAQLPINDAVSADVFGNMIEYGFRGTDSTAYDPYLKAIEGGATMSYDALGARAGTKIDATYSHTFTDIVYAPYHSRTTDDGMVLDKYQFNRLELRWTQSALIPTFGSAALQKLKDNGHSLTLDTQFGYIDRNVSVQDEFRGGGTHPYYMGSGALQPNNQFSGYPGYSLSGETMVVLYGGYKFPVARHIDKKAGPLYIYRLDSQIGATTGNFWSFAPPTAAGSFYTDSFGQRVAYDKSTVHREIPFIDTAYKNGNRLLVDVNAELRMSAMLFGQSGWNSFLRLSWGFNEIKGIGDVNGDDVQDTTDNGIGDALSNETEKPGPRIYLGLGTGW